MKVCLNKINSVLVKIDAWLEGLFLSTCSLCKQGKLKRIGGDVTVNHGKIGVYQCDKCRRILLFKE